MKKIEKYFGKSVKYDGYGTQIWSEKENGSLTHIADVRGWGEIQYLFKNKDGSINIKEAENFQDSVGNFIAEAINEKINLPETLAELEAVKAERDELKAMIEKHQKLQQGMLDALTQAEKERDELREFIIKLWIDSGFLEDTIERLQGKAQQLLTPKS